MESMFKALPINDYRSLRSEWYPMQHLFDKVWSVHAELSHVAILKQVFILSRILNQLDYNLVTISNIVTVAICIF